ncbi:hypothetical protein FRC08_014895 [Ceratobasidium sp. 394]|nr:hypothetical protein FRC08_014895 [Ceratobasidium sp. 394]
MTMASMMNMPNVDPYVPGLDPTYSVGNIGPAPEITAMLPYSWPEELPEPYTMTHLLASGHSLPHTPWHPTFSTAHPFSPGSHFPQHTPHFRPPRSSMPSPPWDHYTHPSPAPHSISTRVRSSGAYSVPAKKSKNSRG